MKPSLALHIAYKLHIILIYSIEVPFFRLYHYANLQDVIFWPTLFLTYLKTYSFLRVFVIVLWRFLLCI